MSNQLPPVQQVLSPGYHGLNLDSRTIAEMVLVDALKPIVTTPEKRRAFIRELHILISLVFERLQNAIAGEPYPHDFGDERVAAAFHALAPLIPDQRTLDALRYDDILIFGQAGTHIHNAMYDEAELANDTATMAALDAIIGPDPDEPEPDPDPLARDQDDADESEDEDEDNERGADHMEPAPPLSDRDELPAHLTRLPGVLGWIIEWIVASAQRPNRVLAVGAAICVLGTLIGRRVSGPTRSGTHMYIAMLAPSAAGKDHPIKRACDLVRLANDHLVGPGEFSSQQGLLAWMADSPLSLCTFDEIGSFISRICNPRGGNWEKGLTKQFREFWGSSFEIVPGSQSAQFSTQPIEWPALTLLGVSTPGEFFDGLSSKEAANGFLNRFLLLSTARKPEYVDEPSADKFEVPSIIQETLISLYEHCVGDAFLIEKQLKDTSLLNERKQIQIGWESLDVKAEYRALMSVIDKKIDNALIGELYGRTAEMAVRLATIHAVSRDGLHAAVTHQDFAWGRELAMWSADTMASQASLRLADNETQARAKHVLRIIYEAGGTIKHRDLNRKLAHRLKPSDLRDTILSLKESGEIGERRAQNPKGGPAMVTYAMRRQ